MLEYSKIIVVTDGVINIKLPVEFRGKKVLIMVQENKSENGTSSDMNKNLKKLINNPYNFDIDPKSTFSREEIYD